MFYVLSINYLCPLSGLLLGSASPLHISGVSLEQVFIRWSLFHFQVILMLSQILDHMCIIKNWKKIGETYWSGRTYPCSVMLSGCSHWPSWTMPTPRKRCPKDIPSSITQKHLYRSCDAVRWSGCGWWGAMFSNPASII